ncbi:WD domain-containing protein [Lindgomyces ingoldianus]|uniref:WD domain-containing protein n=1 Tax=Lindgomyces ingoldianus TaxID=673940 RepID=A0ACB6R296_9PLEO|nr:WD domain-containing protein [Lindgomyces ingoldianus]KAF2472632.1 WD domain-containing protein [Lindgomyces ingoldianus]
MKISNHAAVPVYTISGSNTARPLPDWLIRKRKRSLKQDPEFANRVELLQDFEFEEASSCVRVSDDGDWVMSTGTYKPQIHTHYLPHLSLSFARHTNCLNETFLLLSSDYTKSLHLQADRFLEFHTAGGLHYSTRIPRYGRDLIYDRHSAEALVPAVGVNGDGCGEVFRLNLEVGRFMKAYEVDVGSDDLLTTSVGALQGGISTGSVNTGSIAEASHNLLAFGTSLGNVEFWDARSRNRVGILSAPHNVIDGRSEITALQFHRSGLELATGNSNGLVHLYDLRSPVPLLKRDQGYGFPIKNIIYLNSGTSSRAQTSTPKILTSDKRIIKIWDPSTGTPWTSVEPAVDLNHVEWCRDSGMLLTANEGKSQHAFFIPQLGPAPKWCAFLDNIVEEMAESPDDPNAFGGGAASTVGEVYDNFKFLTAPQLRQLNLDHLVGTTSLLRPYMHGYFVAQKLYEEARLISNPDLWHEQRAKSIQEKIAKERESRIRGNKSVKVKVNRRLAEKMLEREEKNERRRARRVLERGGDDDMLESEHAPAVGEAGVEGDAEPEGKEATRSTGGVLNDPRFARLFQDEDFEVDEASHEFQAINPSTKLHIPKGLTAVEQEALDDPKDSSSEDDSSAESATERAKTPARKQPLSATAQVQDPSRISSSNYKKSGHRPQHPHSHTNANTRAPAPQMRVSSSTRKPQRRQDATFGSRVSKLKDKKPASGSSNTTVVGEREITFVPAKKTKRSVGGEDAASGQGQRHNRKDRRSASGNVFRKM